MRTIIDIPEKLKERLIAMSKKNGVSMAEIIRRAIANLLSEEDKDRSSFFGIWKSKKIDSIKTQRRMRQEWE